MTTYIIRRLLITIPLLIAISIITFALMQFAPGSPAVLDVDPNVPPEAREAQIEAMGLNEPLPVQYARWISGVVTGDFGNSYITKRPVSDMLLERLPNTLILMTAATILAIIIAIPIGIISAVRQYTKTDYAITLVSFAGVAVPNFWIGLMLIMFLSVQFGWFPVGGVQTLNADFNIMDRIHHLFLPALVLATADTAQLTRYTRTSMLEVKNQDYIRTARAKGFKESKVILKHGLRNALLPLITLIAIMLPTLIGGSVVVESVFSWPGLGDLFMTSVNQRDYPVIMIITMLTAVLVVIGNLIADILYAIVDPRIEY
ncbi:MULTISPECIES: ABC transporter permease [Geomicrobium]|uniref:Peptide/nickel transport system permease protein n=1 Tax=Geomicrobium sediminis TaxID=1347788 RepID=A0ABS2PGR9_9BACL|nr:MULTISPECIES: ABC transporter permease [Geomicrobium]MBM7634541.1 peptide/nickel transport system permease protein [Geomicrobium sediminis]GAJ97168.1 oligopeptide transport system permease protein OppB [Geomicrobium sp. JCM 19055]